LSFDQIKNLKHPVEVPNRVKQKQKQGTGKTKTKFGERWDSVKTTGMKSGKKLCLIR